MIFALFILASTHRRIVATLNQGHAEATSILKESHAQTVALLQEQIAELRLDRNYYRERLLQDSERLSPQSSTSLKTDHLPATPAEPADDLFDSWGEGDELEENMEMFREWAAEQIGKLGQATDTKKLWRETYGTSPPLFELTV